MNPLETRELGSTGLSLLILGFGEAPLGELFEKVAETQAQTTLEIAYRRNQILRHCALVRASSQ